MKEYEVVVIGGGPAGHSGEKWSLRGNRGGGHHGEAMVPVDTQSTYGHFDRHLDSLAMDAQGRMRLVPAIVPNVPRQSGTAPP